MSALDTLQKFVRTAGPNHPGWSEALDAIYELRTGHKPEAPKQVADPLEAATERMNETIRRAEALFASRFAVRGSVTRKIPGGPWWTLSWGKALSNGFRLWVQTGEKVQPQPLTNASRETRAAVLPMIEDLYRELETVVPKTTAQVAVEP